MMYSHKHGIDVGVYKTITSARAAAKELMTERAGAFWPANETDKFNKLRSFDKKLARFREIESDFRDRELIDIKPHEVT